MPTTKIQLESGVPPEAGRRDVERLVAQKRGLLWIDLIAPSETELARLQRTFEFHPLSIEDSSHFRQRAKVDQYDGYLFITLYSHRYDSDSHEIVAEELALRPIHDADRSFEQWLAQGGSEIAAIRGAPLGQ